jgi:hypothetical protein
MAASVKKAEIDVAEEQRRIDSAIDAGLPHAAERFACCNTCGATPGVPCLNQGPGQGPLGFPHRRRVDDYDRNGPAIPSPGAALATTPDTSAIARRGLQQAIRAQVLAFCDQEITAKTLDRLQRFCASMGQAMLGIEQPEALVRDRFGRAPGHIGTIGVPGGSGMYDAYGGEYSNNEVIAAAPQIETYGANASRSLIAEAAAIGKDIVTAQAKAHAEARKPLPPTMIELVHALVEAKKQRLPRSVLQTLEQQISEASAKALAATTESA